MQKSNLINYVIKRLTGGGLISFDVSPDLCDEIVDDVLDIVNSWYVESVVAETVEVTLTSSSEADAGNPRNGYINKSALSYPVHYIDTVLPLRLNNRGSYILDEISDLLGLPGGLFTSAATLDFAVWTQTRAMIRKAMSLKMVWKELEDKIYIHKVPSESGSQVTVFYFPLPETLSEVSFGPALNWIKAKIEAEFKLVWSTVLLKSSPDPATIGFANTIRSEANTANDKLEAELPNLQFIYTSFQRN